MGYYTRFELEVANGDTSVIEELRECSDGANYAIYSNGESDDSTKWYEYRDDLKAFSKKHPKQIFKLSGEGEESGDIWVEYFLNGKSQHCKAQIVFADYDERLLE
jgi:hypothetical protein